MTLVRWIKYWLTLPCDWLDLDRNEVGGNARTRHRLAARDAALAIGGTAPLEAGEGD